jgi:hypothetical protein
MKKFIRLLFKIPATPFVVAFCVIGYTLFSILAFFQWAYESSEFNRSVTDECRDDMVGILKRWFTTI